MSAGRIGALLLVACCAAQVTAPAAAEPLPYPPQRVAENVYVLAGEVSAPTPINRGRVANVGVILGSEGIVVVGTGCSDEDGEALLAAIGRLSRKPVLLAIDTYAGPEHVLGNAAFARRGIPILAHRATEAYMAANCDACQRAQQDLIGGGTSAHAERPQRLIDASASIESGGRRLELLHFGTTQQAGSMAVFDGASGVLFAGGLAAFDVVPDLRDADIANWRAALRELRRLPLKQVVPARGPVAAPQRLDEADDYLGAVARETQLAYDRSLGLAEAVTAVELPRFAGWVSYATTHRRNVQFEYLRLEARELGAPR